VASINKKFTPLVKEDENFTAAAPYLFGADFTKRPFGPSEVPESCSFSKCATIHQELP
jgi:hypothetical protein